MTTETLTMPQEISTDFGPVRVDWDGAFLGVLISIDTETTMIESPDKIPELILLSASDGAKNVVVPADRVAGFIEAHLNAHWVFFNVAFDFWVIVDHLRRTGRHDLVEAMWRQVDQGAIHDGQLLDKLVELARTGVVPQEGRSLENLSRQYQVIELDKEKDAKYREHYATLRGKPFDEIDDHGWFIYAAKDAYATIHLYSVLYEEAGKFVGNGATPYGMLSEQIQVKAAIALGSLVRNGVAVDQAGAETLYQQLVDQQAKGIEDIETALEQEGYGDVTLFKRDAEGELERTEKFKPRRHTAALQKILLLELARIGEARGETLYPERTGKGQGVSTKAEHWRAYRSESDFIDQWLSLEDISKQMSMIPRGTDRVHPRYTTMLKTGRTSCSGPNIQQVPRSGGLRELYIPSPGNIFVGVDYSCLELRVLAHLCRQRFGESRLAEVFEQGMDPHEHTARLMLGLSEEQMQQMKTDDPGKFKAERQKSKAINFGVPGGMGAKSLRDYAQTTFGVTMSEAEAKDLRHRLITDIYPELGKYLDEDEMEVMAANLHCPVESLWYGLDFTGDRAGWVPNSTLRVVSGEDKSSGEPYTDRYKDKVWNTLQVLNTNSSLSLDLYSRNAGYELAKGLKQRAVWTETGRLRSGCKFTAARNTPFQALAADGAKLALYRLVREGWHVTAFIHDEIIVEVSQDTDAAEAGLELGRIMCEAMAQVVDRVPIEVGEAEVMERWSK